MIERGFFYIIVGIVLTVTLSAGMVSAEDPVSETSTLEGTITPIMVGSNFADIAAIFRNPGAEASTSGYFKYGTNLELCPSDTCFTMTPVNYADAPPDKIAYARFTELTPSTQYLLQFCLIDGSNGSNSCGQIDTFTTLSTEDPMTMPVPFVSMLPVISVIGSSATLTGRLLDMGAAASVDGYFTYEQLPLQSTSEVTVNAGTCIHSPCPFSVRVFGLHLDTSYQVFACARTATGDICSIVPAMFATPVTPTPILVPRGRPSNVTASSVTVHGEVTDMGGEATLDIFFKYYQVGEPEMTVSAGTLSNVGTFSADISGLKYYTMYVYIPCATTATGEICGDPDILMTYR